MQTTRSMHCNVCAWTPNWLSVTQGDAMWQTKLSEGGKTLVLTIWSDKTQLLTVEQASQLTLPDFSKLWKVRSETYRLSPSVRHCNVLAVAERCIVSRRARLEALSACSNVSKALTLLQNLEQAVYCYAVP